MKRKFSKLISLALVMALMLSTVIIMNTGSVALADGEQSVNLIAGTTPTDFYRATIGTPENRTEYKFTSFEIANNGFHFGYFYDWTDQKAGIVDYIATATDSDAENGYAYNLDKSYVLIYDLGKYASLDSLSVRISTHNSAESNEADFSVYAATTRSGIFSATPATFSIPWGKSGGVNLSGIARYVAIVVAKRGSATRYIGLNNIDLRGSYCENVLSGSLPIRFCSVNKDAYSFNWTTTKATKSGAATYNNHGYTETDGWGRRDGFAPYLSLLTDGDESENLSIEPENRSSSYVLIAYELPEAGTLRGIEIISTDYDSNAEVYASTSKSDLFDSGNMVGSFTRNGSAYTSPNLINTDIDNAKFIGIYMRDTYQSGFCEIKAFVIPSGLSDNLLAGLSPVSGYGVTKGTTTFTYHGVRTSGSNQNSFGYETAPAASSNADFVSAVAKFTDGLTATGTATLYNEWKDGEDALITYKLTERALINNITLDSTSALKTTKVYLSNSFANLYNSESLAATYTTNDSDTSVSIDLPVAKSALYVSFVFDVSKNGGQTLQEIKVRGNYLSDLTASAVAASGTLTNAANAYDEAKDFYNYLKFLGNGNGTMLGAEINVDAYGGTGTRSTNANYYEWLEKTYGTTPVIVSSHINTDSGYWTAALAKRYYDEGSILMFSAGIDSPSVNALAEGDRTAAIRYYDSTYTPSASDEDFYNDVQDEVAASYEAQADFFESLEEAGVKAYIVRPFIEMNLKGVFGNNRWGNDARQNFKNVWQQMYNYFVVERELKGIIFAFAPCAKSGDNMFEAMDYYPGDNYVDIIAPTCYSQTNDGVLPTVSDYAEMIATGKPFAFSEIGLVKTYDVTTRTDCMNLLNSIKTSYPTATFINLWYGANYGINVHSNPETFIKNDYFITTDKLARYKYGNLKDINDDGAADIRDLIRLKRFLAGNSQGVNILVADQDGNRTVAAADVTAYINFLLGK